MPELTKQDVKEAVGEALTPFAGAIQKDITEIKTEITEIKSDVKEIKEDLTITKDKVFVIESEILDIKNKLENIVYRHEFETLKDRITELEKKVGIKK